jgi:hypothetical protein
MNDREEMLLAAHRRSSGHRAELERSEICSCFYCCQTFPVHRIEEWIDEGSTALCPHCGVDAVLGSASGDPVAEQSFLRAMHLRWFGPVDGPA